MEPDADAAAEWSCDEGPWCGDARIVVAFARLGRVTSGVTIFARAAALCAGLAALGACTMSTEASTGTAAALNDDVVVAPLPTIGLGSASGVDPTGNTAIDGGAVESIVMIGDSITVASTEAIKDRFDGFGFGNVTVVAQQGKRIGESFGDNTSGVQIASYLADEYVGDDEEQLWIIALGTNDISQYADSADIDAAVDSVIDAVPADSPLLWVNTYIDGRPADTAAVNASISRAIAQRGNATVGTWNDQAVADGVLSDDGVHPTDQGELTFADVVTITAANFLQR